MCQAGPRPPGLESQSQPEGPASPCPGLSPSSPDWGFLILSTSGAGRIGPSCWFHLLAPHPPPPPCPLPPAHWKRALWPGKPLCHHCCCCCCHFQVSRGWGGQARAKRRTGEAGTAGDRRGAKQVVLGLGAGGGPGPDRQPFLQAPGHSQRLIIFKAWQGRPSP